MLLYSGLCVESLLLKHIKALLVASFINMRLHRKEEENLKRFFET